MGLCSSLLAVWTEETKGPSKRSHANMYLPGLLLPAPLSPLQAAANPHIHRAPTNSQVGLAQSPVGCISFSLGPCAHTQGFVCALQVSLFHHLVKALVIKSRYPSKSDLWGSPGPLPDLWVGKSNVGPRTFMTV